jgi:hypothetical protein
MTPIFNPRARYGSIEVGGTPAGTLPPSFSFITELTDALLESAYAIEISGSYAFVACFGALLSIDISDPENPSIADSVADSALDGAYGLALAGSLAFVAANDADSLTVIDISDPTAMSLVDSITDATIDSARAVAVDGDYAFVACYESDRLVVVDASNPAALSVVTSITHANLNGAIDVKIEDGVAYVASWLANTVVSIDVSTPGSPSILGSSGSLFGLLTNPRRLRVIDGMVYVVSVNADPLTAIDFTTPASPSLASSIFGWGGIDNPFGLCLDGGYAFTVGSGLVAAATTAGSLATYDFIDVSTEGAFGVSGFDLAKSGDHLFVAGGNSDNLAVVRFGS